MVIDRIFIDTNILVYSNLCLSPFHIKAQEQLLYFSELGTGLYLSRQVLKEYLASMTRKNELTSEIEISMIKNDIQMFLEDYYILEENNLVTSKLVELMEEFYVSGKQVHDGNIVATMITHGIKHILTHNVSDFKRYEKYINIIPLES